MLVKYIDSDYIIERLQKPSWGEVEEPDFYITMASNRVKALIFPSEQGDPNNLASYTEEQQEAIKLATAIYTMWYFDTNYDFTNGSVSVNFGGVSMSESKTYNGEMVLPNVFDILKQANLIPTTETFIFNDVMVGNLISDGINPKAFKGLQQEVERQADQNIKQDAKIVDIYDKLEAMGGLNVVGIEEDIETIKEEQVEQNKVIENNANEIETTKTDLADVGKAITDNLNTFKQFKQNQEIINTKFQNDITDIENFNEEFSKYYRRMKYDGVNNGNGKFTFTGLTKIGRYDTKWMIVIMLKYKTDRYITYTFNVVLNGTYDVSKTILNLFYEDRWYNIKVSLDITLDDPELYIDATSLNQNLNTYYTMDIWCIYTGRL